MNDGLIPNRYAKALYKFAVEQKQDDAVYQQTSKLADSYNAMKELAGTVENPYLSLSDKVNVLMTASGAEPNSCMGKFFELVFSHGREAYLHSMALSYGKMYREANKISQVEIVTASELSDDEMAKIKVSVQTYLSGRTLEYKQSVDAELIAGFKIKVDSQQLDASISSELRNLRLKLLRKK